MSFIGTAIGGSVVSGLLGYEGAKSAANTQAQSANNALQFQEQVYNSNQPRFAAANTAFGNAQNTANSSFGTSMGALGAAGANFQPWITTGQNANYTLGQLTGTGTQTNRPDYSSFFNDPSFLFTQQQGNKAIINGANAQGVGLSGGALKDLDTFNTGLASQQYGNYFNRLMGLSQAGQNAAAGFANNAGNIAGAANNYATTSANIAGGIGNLATGAANSNNAAGTSIGNTTQAIGQAQASGIVGGTNAITGGINNGVSNSLLWNAIQRQNPSAYGSGNAGAINSGAQPGVSNGGFNFLDAQA